jgi:hypothetical protein
MSDDREPPIQPFLPRRSVLEKASRIEQGSAISLAVRLPENWPARDQGHAAILEPVRLNVAELRWQVRDTGYGYVGRGRPPDTQSISGKKR